MSDQLEKFIRKNREQLDSQNPGDNVWNNIQHGLQPNTPPNGGNGPQAPGSGGLVGKWAALSTGVKLTLGSVATLVLATAIYLGVTSNNASPDPSGIENTTLSAAGGEREKAPAEQVALVQPPMQQADIALGNYSIDADRGGSIEMASGTRITAPESAFVDAQGIPVSGKVDIQYREFMDAFDAMLSGIPMTYNDNGTIEHFQTAGMMEIRGSQNGQPVFIAPGKELQIQLASSAPLADDYGGAVDLQEEDSYNLYVIDEEEGGWVEIGKPVPTVNKEREARIMELEKRKKKWRKPRKPARETSENLDRAITIQFDTQEFPELRPFKKVKWEAVDQTYLDENQWALTRRWNDVKLSQIDEQANSYRITFSNKKQKFVLDVVPMLSGSDYDKAMAAFNEKLSSYNNMVAQKARELERLQSQSSVLRSFNISGFGIFNCDRFYRMPDAVTLRGEIKLPEGIYANLGTTAIFQIAGQERALVARTAKEIENGIKFSPSDRTYLVMVLSENQIGVVRPATLDKIGQQIEGGEQEVFPLELETLEQEITSAADIRAALNI